MKKSTTPHSPEMDAEMDVEMDAEIAEVPSETSRNNNSSAPTLLRQPMIRAAATNFRVAPTSESHSTTIVTEMPKPL